MRQRLLGLALGLSLFALVLSRLGGPEPAPSAASPAGSPAPPVAPLPAASPAEGPVRNLFEYASEAPPGARAPVEPTAPRAAPTPVPSPEGESRVRLVGLLRRGGKLKAVLALSGEVVVVGVGEAALGYTVLAVDEDEGVRLRDPGGVESVLRP